MQTGAKLQVKIMTVCRFLIQDLRGMTCHEDLCRFSRGVVIRNPGFTRGWFLQFRIVPEGHIQRPGL